MNPQQIRFSTLRALKFFAFCTILGTQICVAQEAAEMAPNAMARTVLTPAKHAAVGSWLGRAVQLCADPANPITCPKFTIIMTPNISADGAFTGVDHTAIGGPPLGPHTAAFGEWIASNATTIIADYVFISNAIPVSSVPVVSLSRFRWVSQVTDANTMIGYINFYPFPPVPVVWESITDPAKFPPLPAETAGPLVSPLGLVTDPKTCLSASCPLVFKFTVKRVTPGGWGF